MSEIVELLSRQGRDNSICVWNLKELLVLANSSQPQPSPIVTLLDSDHSFCKMAIGVPTTHKSCRTTATAVVAGLQSEQEPEPEPEPDPGTCPRKRASEPMEIEMAPRLVGLASTSDRNLSIWDTYAPTECQPCAYVGGCTAFVFATTCMTYGHRFAMDPINFSLLALIHLHEPNGIRSRKSSADITIEAQAAVEAETEGAAVQSGQCMCMHFCTILPPSSGSAGVDEAAGAAPVLTLLAGYEDGKVAVYTQTPTGRWQPAMSIKLHEEPVLSIAEATVRCHWLCLGTLFGCVLASDTGGTVGEPLALRSIQAAGLGNAQRLGSSAAVLMDESLCGKYMSPRLLKK